ncbi:MAG: iron chelate uptake ABC transporter family permease subunit [Clostridia bacterium]|jgi:iron complex transport system permease protein
MKRFKRSWIIPLMLMILAVVIVVAASIGTVYVPIQSIIRIILNKLGLVNNSGFEPYQMAIIYSVRLPRVLAAVLIGSALATTGAVLQGMFRNPMADPGIIGVSSGAGLGAVTAIALGLSASSIFYLPLFASVGALLAALIIFVLSLRGGKVAVFTLILSGIAVSTFLGAITSMILSFTSKDNVHEFLFWSMGNLYSIRWESVQLVFIPIIIGVVILITFARDLNVMLLGEEEAQSVGVNSSKIRMLILIVASITTAAAVCISGPISFVGLIVPHIMRIILGPDHRLLLPASAVAGAIFLVICDLIARIAFAPIEINVGIITSLVGAPYFLYLLIRSRRAGGVF